MRYNNWGSDRESEILQKIPARIEGQSWDEKTGFKKEIFRAEANACAQVSSVFGKSCFVRLLFVSTHFQSVDELKVKIAEFMKRVKSKEPQQSKEMLKRIQVSLNLSPFSEQCSYLIVTSRKFANMFVK